MAAIVPSLWPDDIKLEVLSPLFILKSQAREIRKATDGRLDAEVTTVSGESDFVVHRLDLIPTQLDRSRHRILAATHRESLYPVVLEAEVFRPQMPKRSLAEISAATGFGAVIRALSTGELMSEKDAWPRQGDWRPVASSQDAFIDRVRDVLRSAQVRALIESLLARTYEKVMESQNDSPLNGDPSPA